MHSLKGFEGAEIALRARIRLFGRLSTILSIAASAMLPIEARGSTWGDEIYFSIPVRLSEENGKEVELGDIAYWPPGTAFCIFFGPTPASHGDEIRPARGTL